MKALKFIGFSLILFFAATPLFAGSIINEGDSPVQVSGRTASGITGSVTLLPGQTSPIRQKFVWLKHVPGDSSKTIRIKIINDDGTTGYINSLGGQYTFPEAREKAYQEKRNVERPKPKLQPGYVTNNSNVQLYITTISSHLGAQRTLTAMPGQTLSLPEDVVEVRTQPLNSRADSKISLEVVLPDGSRHHISSPHGSAHLKED